MQGLNAIIILFFWYRSGFELFPQAMNLGEYRAYPSSPCYLHLPQAVQIFGRRYPVYPGMAR